MAMGEPPRANVSSFRLLFMIVRDDPPALDGSFSTDFKDFVWRCLRKVGARWRCLRSILLLSFWGGGWCCLCRARVGGCKVFDAGTAASHLRSSQLL